MSSHIKRRASEGKWIAVYPFGYERVIAEDGVSIEITINKQQAEIVKKIFDLYTSGDYSFENIAQYINSNYKTVMYKAKIENIIKKSFYYGDMKIKGELYPHNYGAIITKEIFDQAQEIAAKRRGRWISPLNK